MLLKKVMVLCVFIFVILGLVKNAYGQVIQFYDNPNIYIEGLEEGYGTNVIINTIEMCSKKKNFTMIRDHVNELIKDKEVKFMIRIEEGQSYELVYSNIWIIEILGGPNYIIMTDVNRYYYKVYQVEINQEVINDLKETLLENNILQLKSNTDNIFVKDPSVYYFSVYLNKEKNQFAVICPFFLEQNVYKNIINQIKNILEDRNQFMTKGTATEYMSNPLSNRGEIIISDEYLEKEIRITLDKAEGELSISELETIEVIVSNTENISDLKGIEYLKNLKVLVLNSSKIEDIRPLKKLYNLEVLKLANNNIKDISSLSNLINLEELNLNKNNISNIEPLSNLRNLRTLSLSKNEISDISSLSSIVLLMDLDLSYNKIRDISSLQKLNNLNELNLSFNLIEDLSPLDSQNNLKGLQLMNNNIKNIYPLKQLHNLEYLIIYNNPVDNFDCLNELNVLIYR